MIRGIMTRIMTKKMMRSSGRIGVKVVMVGQEEDMAAAREEVTRREPAGIAMMTRIMMKTTMRIMTKKMMTGEEEAEAVSVLDVVRVKVLVQ